MTKDKKITGLRTEHMKLDAITALAQFLTGGQNGHHSIGLEAGGFHRVPAQNFFNLKRVLLGEHVQDSEQAAKRLWELLK